MQQTKGTKRGEGGSTVECYKTRRIKSVAMVRKMFLTLADDGTILFTCQWFHCCGLLANIDVGQKDNTTEFCHIYTLQARIIMSTQEYAEALKSNSFGSGNFWQLCLMYLDVLPTDTVDSITPDKVRGLRDMLNSSAMDIMYYTSPLYRDEVSEKAPPFQHSG